MSGRTLVIETGAWCNNRCAMCNQWATRSRGALLGGPSTEDVVARLRAGRESGYSFVGFSGGEPTVRKDIAELVARARGMGYEGVGITTNGRMLARPGLARKLVEAGLTSASVTLQGPEPGVHDALTGVTGSFRQTVKGMARLRAAGGGGFSMSSITVVVKENAAHLPRTLRTAAALGARLHIVQPFIAARENLFTAERFLLGLSDLAGAIERAAGVVAAMGTRIKPFNIPPCVLSHLGDVIEMPRYEVSTFHEFFTGIDEPPGFVLDGQTWKVAGCAGCGAPCPGFRIEHLPDRVMADAILEDAESFVAGRAGRAMVLTSTDLLTPDTLDRVVQGVARVAGGRLDVAWGGWARHSFEEFLDSCTRAGVHEMVMIAQPPALRPPDRHVRLPGNTRKLEADIASIGRNGPRPSLMLVVGTMFTDDFEFGPERADSLVEGVARAGGKRIYLVAPDEINDGCPRPDEALAKRIVEGLEGLVRDWELKGMEVRLLDVPDQPDGEGVTLQRRVRHLAARVDWSGILLPHRFTGLGFGWVMWSNPIWLFPRPPVTS